MRRSAPLLAFKETSEESRKANEGRYYRSEESRKANEGRYYRSEESRKANEGRKPRSEAHVGDGLRNARIIKACPKNALRLSYRYSAIGHDTKKNGRPLRSNGLKL